MAKRHARIEGDNLVKQLLSEMADRTTGVAAVWPKVGDVVADTMRRQFDSEGVELTGHPWAPLSPPYLAWKIRKGFSPLRLRQTEDMMKSFTSRPMDVEEYRPMSATFGSSDRKAKWHQGGTKHMPERPIIVVTPDFADDVTQVIARYIFENRLS